MTSEKPRIGLMVIMQDLYDAMLPGITERQSDYARAIAAQLGDVAEVIFPKAVRNRADAEEVVAQFEREGLDGILIVMLTYGPAMNVTRALVNTRLPLMLANTQPERSITPAWDMGDMTYNQGVHGAQDQANALVRAGVPLPVITDDWRSETFKRQFEDWARAAATVSRLRRMKVAIFGYAMNGMGDIRVDETAMLRRLGPEIRFLATGDLYRAMQAATDAEVAQVIEQENDWFEVDPSCRRRSARIGALPGGAEEDSGRGGLRRVLHALRRDCRGRALQLPAGRRCVKLDGAGLRFRRGRRRVQRDPGRRGAPASQGRALYRDVRYGLRSRHALLSHMGEGNWKVARTDEPVRLIDRPLGIGGLDNPPTVLFRIQPGPATLTRWCRWVASTSAWCCPKARSSRTRP